MKCPFRSSTVQLVLAFEFDFNGPRKPPMYWFVDLYNLHTVGARAGSRLPKIAIPGTWIIFRPN